MIKFLWRSNAVFPEIWAKLWKNALSSDVEEFLKKILDIDPEADVFQNLVSSSSSTDMFVVKFSGKYV